MLFVNTTDDSYVTHKSTVWLKWIRLPHSEQKRGHSLTVCMVFDSLQLVLKLHNKMWRKNPLLVDNNLENIRSAVTLLKNAVRFAALVQLVACWSRIQRWFENVEIILYLPLSARHYWIWFQPQPHRFLYPPAYSPSPAACGSVCLRTRWCHICLPVLIDCSFRPTWF